MVILPLNQLLETIGACQPFSFVVEPSDIGETEPWFGGKLVVSGQIANVGENLRVTGRITGKATMECGRCLKVFEQAIDFGFEEDLERDDIDHQNSCVDLAETIRSNMIFQEPMQPLCGDDCKGICFHCGKDLNQEGCSCNYDKVDPRLAVLGQLLKK